jgi:hypothetical protein
MKKHKHKQKHLKLSDSVYWEAFKVNTDMGLHVYISKLFPFTVLSKIANASYVPVRQSINNSVATSIVDYLQNRNHGKTKIDAFPSY